MTTTVCLACFNNATMSDCYNCPEFKKDKKERRLENKKKHIQFVRELNMCRREGWL